MLRGATAMVGAVLALTACAANADRDRAQPVAVQLALVHASRVNLDGALVGQLAVNGQCLVIIDDAGRRYGVAWPSPGTVWDPATQTLKVMGSAARIGQWVSVGGGELPLDPAVVRDYPWVKAPARECIQERFWRASFMDAVDTDGP